MKTIIEKFEQLKMKACAQNLEQVMKLAEEKNQPSLDVIEHLLDFELEAKRIRRVALRFKESRLIEKPTIDQFDFNFHVSRKNLKTRILNLMTLEFIKQKKDIILIGNPGVGKSFLAKCVAYGATQTGIKTLFTTATDMINHLISAEADHSLLKKLHFYQSQDILVCDELCKALHNSSYDKLNVM
ncbi:MAG: ATP-binding protein [Pseudomonadota bacterium]|nr:ATP-binding protein [Pseudomonadota bacterium]